VTAVELIGHLAGVLTTFSASPQLVYSYRTRDVASFDLKFLLMLAAGLFLWAVYGVLISSLPIVVFNLIGGSLWLPIIAMKFATIRADKRRKR
jgi:MtN3 and saliva related transmembrane protein